MQPDLSRYADLSEFPDGSLLSRTPRYPEEESGVLRLNGVSLVDGKSAFAVSAFATGVFCQGFFEFLAPEIGPEHICHKQF